MDNKQRNEAILTAIRDQTAKNTVSKKAARDALIATGIYTKKGKVSGRYGG